MTKEEFEKLLRSSEKKRVEFKGKVDFKVFQEHFAVTLISMANINGGGIIIVGVNNSIPHEVEGLTDEELKSFDKTFICNYLQNKVSPLPDFDPEIFPINGKNVLVFHIKEFNDVPHIITNQIILKKYRKYKPGDILIRTESAQSRRIQNENEMRELVSLSMRKRSELLLSDIKSIITGQVQKSDEKPEELFDKNLVEFEKLATDFRKANDGLVFWKLQFVPIPLVNNNLKPIQHLEKSLITKNADSFPSYYGVRNNIQTIHNSLTLTNLDLEYWRLSRELCFGMYKGIWSELEPQSGRFDYKLPPNRPLPYIILISDLIDFFTFCKNLVFEENIDSVWINVELYNTKNRYIGSYHDLRFRLNSGNCLSDKIKNTAIYSKGNFISSYKNIAIEYILLIFENFQHNYLSTASVIKMYEDVLKKEFGT
ncbi:MAG: putative DNA binding domain-containing protein [Leptospiraceae bacterium]|nr:putative DNA binding domain-containing protein [Leptospiraceae bacterium]